MATTGIGDDLARIALVGFGEAAQAFLDGWRTIHPDLVPSAYDRKTGSNCTGQRHAKLAEYQKKSVQGHETNHEATAGAEAVFSLVTADQAREAAAETARRPLDGAFFLDCNSCSPGAKRDSAAVIEGAGGRYVDVAVMSPVHPRLHRTPMLLAGPHARAARDFLAGRLGMDASAIEGPVGAASSVKMVRSIMVKGLEALALECVIAGRRAGVDDMVLDTLEDSYPGFGWKKRVTYMMERAATHGIRRAAEMREVAITVGDLGLDPAMSEAIARWQQAVGELGVRASGLDQSDHKALADAISAALENAMASRTDIDPAFNGTNGRKGE